MDDPLSGIATVRVGGLDRSALRDALRSRGVMLNRAAEALFDDERFVTSPREHAVEVRALCGAELGLEEGVTYERLVALARDAGLSECPLELAAHLRLTWPDQPEAPPADASAQRAPAGSLTVASAPLDDARDTPRGFYLVRRDGAPWLRGYWASAGHVWDPRDVFVFCRSPA